MSFFEICASGLLVRCLFNITADPTEHHDVAAERPEVVEELLQMFFKLNDEYHGSDSRSFGGDQDGYCAAAAKNGGFMVPWRDAPVGHDSEGGMGA